MLIFPAVDIKDGNVVRLFQGDYDKMTVYGNDPLGVALGFEEAGAGYLHVVDLDGAKDGRLVNFEAVKKIVDNTGLFVEIGGGIRDRERIVRYLEAGVGRVILGSAAVEDKAFLEQSVSEFGDKIAVGVDARDGKVATRGWTNTTESDSFEFCRYLEGIGVEAVIYTDIARDGSGAGTNIDAYRKLKKISGLKITASGGINDIKEIETLRDITYAAILGRSLYTGAVDLAEAIRIGGGMQ